MIDRQTNPSAWRSLLGHRPPRRRGRPRRIQPEAPAAPPSAEQRRADEIQQELMLARDIQQGLLLEAAPHLVGWEISAISLPARDLGGDLYDFLRLGEHTHGIMIGDVSGKGLPAALRMAVARTVFRHEARRNQPPAITLAGVNQGVLSEIPQGMVTMLYARLDIVSGELHLANAGHTFPLLVRTTMQEIEISGLPLGVDVESDYTETTVWLHPGESVVLYTDGVLEAENAASEIFGYERLEAVVAANPHLKPRAMVAMLLRELREWAGSAVQSDDITIVVLRRRLTDLNAELRSIVLDVLGDTVGQEFWANELAPLSHSNAMMWITTLPEIMKRNQNQLGRGLTRELNQQLRLALEDYRGV
ncbi:protein serine/threonine phosphatase [Oscillochloris trichoides DG-6]|uniref:Protein serine/threonine phosphatase n=1 Tax=Oscillochloris trichoides DG-6 TaxID=765420 RepID=E1IGI3_9CHLR|nr:PP2C family protein-serine/threonine phosphatase [Oscillochloris trichoides]EFO79749.1 protein serine/threonine phosphatase [Oscillochloris trichoides DG-6]